MAEANNARENIDNIFERIHLKKRKEYLKLMEVSDLTEELAQAVDRRDEVSVKMLLNMRQGLLVELSEIERGVWSDVESRPEEEAILLGTILRAVQPAEDCPQPELESQVQKNRRLLERICELDKRVSLKLGSGRSFYNSFR